MPRFVPATVSELSRVSLLASVPGEELMKIARRLEREEVPPGRQVVREGEHGERFYLSEVALAMNVPRTASVRALTPAVVASCDRETFDELLRPLFAED